jgi:hypothetical protein
MKISEIERRAFVANPELRLIDIPKQAAFTAGEEVSHADLTKAIKQAQKEYRAMRATRRRGVAAK